MKRTFLLLFSLFSLVSLQAENKVSLTLIPPGKITNKIDLDIRGGIVNESASQQTYQVALYWNKENKDALLYETVVTIPAGKAETVKVVIPTKDRVGKNKVIFKVANEGKAYRKTKDIEVIESDIRSIQQISGAWTGIYHWSEIEGKHWNQDIKKMTDDQWRELIRSMNKLEMNMVVIQEVFRNEEYVGKHTTNVDNYVGKAFYPSKLYPGRMELTAKDPIEAILTEADKQGMNVLMGVGMFAWFDFTPESLEWHKRVAKELWDMYGHHESFYAFYVSEESGGGLDNWEQRPEMRKKRKDDIVNFFKEFKEERHEKLPVDVQLGFSKRLSHAPFRLSLTLHDLTHWSASTTAANNFGKKLLNHIALGIDFLPTNNFYLAAGYNFRRGEEMKINGSSHWAGFTCGTGIQLKRLKLGMAYAKYHVSSSSLIFNLSYTL